MKTLKITLVAALMVLSLNTFAETCNPCIVEGNMKEESITLSAEEMPRDVKVNDMLQKMTSAIRQQLLNVGAITENQPKHSKKSARK
jgi:hypothetical protein